MSDLVPQEAIEAAAQSVSADNNDPDLRGLPDIAFYEAAAAHALNAAAPFIAAQALADAAAAALRDRADNIEAGQ